MEIKQKINDFIIDVTDVNSIENYISEIINPTKNLILEKNEISFVSVVDKNVISEKEFLEIVDMKRNKVTSKTGAYQEKLYGNYMKALNENDNGYLNDVLNKAVELKNNLLIVRSLMQNKLFMSIWHKNIGKISPLTELKNTGSMRRIELVKKLML